MLMAEPTEKELIPQEPVDEIVDEQTVDATPEEQDQYEDASLAAMDMIHGDAAGDQIADTVLQAQDVSQGIGKAVAMVIIGVEKSLGGLFEDVKLELAQDVTEELMNLAAEAGALAEDEIDENLLDAVVSHAYTEYLKFKETLGELDINELEASVSQAEQAMGIQSPARRQMSQQRTPAPQGLMGA